MRSFCENSTCMLNEYKVNDDKHEMIVESGGVRRQISRHVYADVSSQSGDIIYLCSICHTAVQLVAKGSRA